MILEKVLGKGMNWIKENSKNYIFAFAGDNSATRVICDSDETSLEEFLKVGNEIGVKIFIITKTVFYKSDVIKGIDFEQFETPETNELEALAKKTGQV